MRGMSSSGINRTAADVNRVNIPYYNRYGSTLSLMVVIDRLHLRPVGSTFSSPYYLEEFLGRMGVWYMGKASRVRV